MGFDLFPKDERMESVSVNFWNWRPTAELIGTFGLIDEERLELMQIQCCGAEVTGEEASAIADRIEAEILANLPNEGRVRRDLTVTTEPDDNTFYQGDDFEKNYGATADWLREFVVFCRTSGGFTVI